MKHLNVSQQGWEWLNKHANTYCYIIHDQIGSRPTYINREIYLKTP